ncbi:hypothetical protein [Klebsiella sp. CN_Kp100]|uniref:hypothetical protein n=1 Tax=Klebsiella sp. CN_Kp100 TaxID=3153422 RepID=UPI0032B46FF0
MTTDITELAQSLKAAADREMICRDGAETSEIWERTVTPENILTLVEALEKAQQERENWRTSFDNERFRADKLAAVLNDEIEQAANVRGQLLIAHKTLLNQQAKLAKLESRTVKLPDDEDGQAYGFGKWSNGKLPATAGTMTIAYCEDAWRAAFEVFSSAAGIKVEAE